MTTEQDIKEMIERCDQHRKEIAERLATGSRNFTEINGRINNLEVRHSELADAIREMTDELKQMVTTLTDIRLDMATGRPSWAILALITTLFSTCVGLSVYVVTHL